MHPHTTHLFYHNLHLKHVEKLLSAPLAPHIPKAGLTLRDWFHDKMRQEGSYRGVKCKDYDRIDALYGGVYLV
jgi:hypothetical protein